MAMTIRITQLLQRTIDVEVDECNEEEAVAAALLRAADVQDDDWHYCEPISEEGCSADD
jgi:hypothetical protein